MRRISLLLQTILTSGTMVCLSVIGMSANAHAQVAPAPSLVISQLKITSSNGQFVTLYNATNAALDLSSYQLEYFNHYDLAKATSSRLIALSGSLPSHSYYMVNDSSILMCYQMTVYSTSLGLSSTAGMLQIIGLQQNVVGGLVGPTATDYVAWSKSPAVGVQTLPTSTNAFLIRQPYNISNQPDVLGVGSGSWLAVQPDTKDSCKLITTTSSAPSTVASGPSLLLPGLEPSVPGGDLANMDGVDQPTASGLPVQDIGLRAPVITEIMPNPIGAGTDSNDEFVELYNPNAVAFDMTGFSLQSGSTTTHKFLFTQGTLLPANSYTAFFSSTTKLTLSNTAGQVMLIDPTGNSISATAVYQGAKDGQSWALANGKWYWTTSPTPGKTNHISQPKSKKQTNSAKKYSAKRSSSLSKQKKLKSADTVSSFSQQDNPAGSKIHGRIIALMLGGALLYALYEYKADLANKIYMFRRYLKTRHGDRV